MTRFTFILVILAACSKSGGGGPAGDTDQPVSTGKIDVAGANALVPASLKDKIVFEQRDLVTEMGKDKTTYTFAMPKGWTQDSKMWASLKPDDKGGFFSSMKIQTDCDGECAPKPWESIADKNFFAKRAKGKVQKDVKAPGTRLMIADMDENGVKTTDVVFAWWTEGAKRYHVCVAALDEAIKDAAPAFEKACQAITIAGRE